MNKKQSTSILIGIVILLVLLMSSCTKHLHQKVVNTVLNEDTFKIIASTSTKAMDKDIIDYGRQKGINIMIEHHGDLEIVDILNNNSEDYNAVWISNSLWFYMLNNPNIITNSKSIVINPVVLGIQKEKAKEIDFTDKNIYNSDILKAVKEEKIKYIMSSVTKTNTGATSYLSFLNSLAGSPEVLTEKMLDDEKLVTDLKDLFQGVKRVSGDEDYLTTMYLKGNYNAMINYESSLIKLNKQLEKQGKEPLYLIYPKDGVAINDMPFAYINNDINNDYKKEQFETIQSYLTSKTMIKNMEKQGYRSWYGGINKNADKNIFNPDWGIDTSSYLKDMKYPSKKVITKALKLYANSLRKPAHVVFCLDVSGSMSGSGLTELKDAMNYILNYETASKDLIQFADKDKISIITFNERIDKIYPTKYGNQTKEIMQNINNLAAGGGTNIYDPSHIALRILSKDTDDNIKTVILMTDGMSNSGSYSSLATYYNNNKLDIPIYSITFGSSNENQLNAIASLTNGKIFDGKNGLKRAFTEVRSYN